MKYAIVNVMTTIDFEKMNGLVPAIVQDSETNEVLMLGFMNADSLQKTLDTRLVTFWSRSRNELWTKGETSGNTLHLVEMFVDCDQDTILVKATMGGDKVCCHTGERSCFFTPLTKQS